MAGERNCKVNNKRGGSGVPLNTSKGIVKTKCELYVEKFACDVLYFILRLCGLPKKLLISEERENNYYEDSNQIFKDSIIVLNVAFSMRDQWKIMFESRFKSSGMGMIEKIDDYLKSFLSISREFQQGNNFTKTKVSLAAYSEMILFLNYKGIEFDFERMIISWTKHSFELIAEQSEKCKSLPNLFPEPSDPLEFGKWLEPFMKSFAIPYGRRNDVSYLFCQYLEEQKQIKNEEKLEKQKIYAHFVSQTVTAVAAGGYDPILPPCFESPAVLPGNRESPEPPKVCSTKNGARRNVKKSKRRSVRPVVPPALDTLTVCPGKRESSELTGCFNKSGARGKDKESRRPSTRLTDVMVGRRKPDMEQLLEEDLKQMSLSNPENKQKD